MLVRQKRNTKPLILGILGFITLAFFADKFSPDSIPTVSVFLLIFLLSGFFLSQYLLNNVRRALFISLGFTIWLSLRAAGLREPIYPILLTACLVSLELLARNKKP